MKIIQSNIIYNFEDLRALLLDKSKEGSFYLLFDDIYFEEIEKNTSVTRDVYSLAQRILKPISIIKYISFKSKERHTIGDVYSFINFLRNNTTIIITFFNPKENECTLIFVSNKDDSLLEKHIRTFVELEEF